MSTTNAVLVVPAWVSDDALELALEDVSEARADDPELSEADLWSYGRRMVDEWIRRWRRDQRKPLPVAYR